MEKNFVGIDVSKSSFDVAVLIPGSKGFRHEKGYSNNIEGYKALIHDLLKLKLDLAECWFVLEHTGIYSLLLTCFLQEQGHCFSVVPALQIKKSLGITRGKNDRIDARRIAEYSQLFQKKMLPTEIDSKTLLLVRELLTYRNQLIKQSTQLKNSLKAHQQMIKVTKANWIAEEMDEMIAQLKEKCKGVEKEIKELINHDEDLQSNYNLVQTVKGVGPLIAAYMLYFTANFETFREGRKFACYAGIAPFEHSSGTSIRGKTKISPMGNKVMKILLYNGANCAARTDPELAEYYQRKIREGKSHNLIINAIACKLVYRCFAVINRQTPYVSLYEKKVRKSLAMS